MGHLHIPNGDRVGTDLKRYGLSEHPFSMWAYFLLALLALAVNETTYHTVAYLTDTARVLRSQLTIDRQLVTIQQTRCEEKAAMNFLKILWDEEEDPDGNVQHIADHDLTVEDVDHVLSNPSREGVSRSTSLPVVWGYTSDDRYILVVYEKADEETIRVITAYEVPEPRNH